MNPTKRRRNKRQRKNRAGARINRMVAGYLASDEYASTKFSVRIQDQIRWWEKDGHSARFNDNVSLSAEVKPERHESPID